MVDGNEMDGRYQREQLVCYPANQHRECADNKSVTA